MTLSYTTTSIRPLRSEVTTRGASPTPLAMMVYDEHGVPVFAPLACLIPRLRPRHMARGQELLSGHLISQMFKKPNPVVERASTTTDPASHVNLMMADWEAFAMDPMKNFTRKYMFKAWRIEKRRR